MTSERVKRNILTGVACALLFAFTAASAWAIVSDYQTRFIVPRGVSLEGHDLSGMDPAQVRATIEQAVAVPAMRPLMVSADGTSSWTLDPSGIVSVDEGGMVAQAYAPLRTATLVTRVIDKVTGRPLPATVKPAYSVDTTALAAWVAETAKHVDHKPVDATRTVVAYSIRIEPEVDGVSVDQSAAVQQLTQALTSDSNLSSVERSAQLPTTILKPKVLASSFKMAIVVNLSACQVRLFDGDKLVKTYPCAPGQPAWPTPTGDFYIVSKQIDAPWLNPHDAWSASMPDVIPGGPDNPMGDRKIGIDYPGVFLHGIPPGEFGSIGSHASHGCMRMYPSAIHDLFPRVQIGDPVFIRE